LRRLQRSTRQRRTICRSIGSQCLEAEANAHRRIEVVAGEIAVR
jgi:hypothetical protein